jgi:predicted outer membrane repeat protein
LVDYQGTLTGNAGSADNAQVLSSTAPYVSNFRTSVVQGILPEVFNLEVVEGNYSNLSVRLSAKPANAVEVSLSSSGDSDLMLMSGATLNFDSTNWNLPHTVQLYAKPDSDLTSDTGTLILSSTGMPSISVALSEVDNSSNLISGVLLSGVVVNELGVGLGGVSLTLSNGGGQVITDAGGSFLLELSTNWSGAVTPLRDGFSFSPSTLNLGPLSADSLGHSMVASRSDILYVHGTATGAGDGTSWANAYTDLGDALRSTNLFTEVWVATGTYKAGMVRSSTFLIPPNIAVYGGFSGNEVSRVNRDVSANVTILSGDLGILNNNTDNAFHVVVPSQGSVLDGFTITGGNASENFTNDDRGKGAGLWADSASITVSNCKFISNNAYQGGAAIYLKDVNGTFSNCEIISNTTNSTGSGAGLYLEDSNVSFTSSIFSDNQAHLHAGAIRSENSEINLLNCSLSSNRSLTSNGGGAMYLNGGIFSIKSTSFTNNQATFQGGAILISGASGSMEDSNFTGNQNTNSNGGGALLIENSSPSILRCRFIENSTSANNYGGAIKLDTSSASITDSIFIGNRSLTNSAGAIYFDSSSSPSFSNNEFRLNSAAQFGGAFFVNGSNLNLTGDLFLGNYANNGGGIATQGTMSVSLSNVRALGNEANSTSSSSAGFIYLNSGVTSSTFMNSVFSGNKSLGRHGVYRSNGPSRFVNCSIVGNEAGTEGGVTLMFAGDSIELDNCIVWGNTAGIGNDIYVNSGTASANYSLFNPSESIGTISGSSNLNSNPLFVDSDGADNISGTLDDDVSLQSGSPAIDQGSSSLANFSTSDVLSRNRVGSPDMGAYEFASNSVPAFTSGNIFSLSENLTLVTNLNASDLDGDAIVFSISGGVDQNQFSVEASTGLLSFVSAPDFETPTDSGGDNSYTVEVSVSDGNSTSTLLLTISVVDVSEQGSGQASTHNADLNATVQLQMLWVEPGTFTMGSPTTEAGRSTNETEHNVTLTKGFYLGKYEVTQAQYEAVMTGNTDSLSATPSEWPNNPNRPVEKVSWADAQIFLTRLNAQQSANIPAGWAYVLPTEAEWEYACRAGTTTAYSWGATIATSNANYSSSGLNQTSDAGNYAANPWGFFDMHGNVWEWTADAWGNYATGAQTDPFNGGASGSSRVIRGGSWNYAGVHLRSARRSDNAPSNRYDRIGFRVGFKQQ